MKRLIRRLGVLFTCLLPCPALSWDFRIADVEGLANVTLAYGLLSRMQGRDKDIIAIANGGTLPSANTNVGLAGEYVNRWTADLGYPRFLGGGSANLVRDRDFLSFQVAYHY